MDKLLAFVAMVGGCISSGGLDTPDLARPAVPCAVSIIEPFAFSWSSGPGVTCARTDKGASFAAVTGEVALLRVDGARVAFISHVGDLVEACDEFKGEIAHELPPRWALHLDVEGCGVRLVGMIYGDTDAH